MHTVTVLLFDGPATGQRVQAPVLRLGGPPLDPLEVVVVDERAHALDGAPEEVMARVAPEQVAIYRRHTPTTDGSLIYLHAGPRTSGGRS